MKKHILAFAVLFFSVFTVIAQDHSTFPKDIIFRTLDNVIITEKDFPKDKPLLLYYFAPDCGHCKISGKELGKSLAEYPDVEIWMISVYPDHEVKQYLINSGLYPAKKLLVMQDNLHKMHDWFDFDSIPLMLLYNTDKKIIKDFDKLPEPIELRKMLAELEE